MKNNYILLFSLICLINGCALTKWDADPHDEFVYRLNSMLGKNVYEAGGGLAILDYDNPVELINNNIEYSSSLPRRNCKYYAEVDPKTKIILSVRYEGDECRVSPWN